MFELIPHQCTNKKIDSFNHRLPSPLLSICVFEGEGHCNLIKEEVSFIWPNSFIGFSLSSFSYFREMYNKPAQRLLNYFWSYGLGPLDFDEDASKAFF